MAATVKLIRNRFRSGQVKSKILMFSSSITANELVAIGVEEVLGKGTRVFLDGRTPAEQRKKYIQDFNNPRSNIKVGLCSSKAWCRGAQSGWSK